MTRWLPVALLLGGCGLLSPMQDLTLANESTLPVTVRIGPFKPGTSVVKDTQAIQTTILGPTQSTTLQLPTGHYEVYAEAPGEGAPAVGDDVTLKASQAVKMVLNERYEDHVPEGQHEGIRVRVLGWTKF